MKSVLYIPSGSNYDFRYTQQYRGLVADLATIILPQDRPMTIAGLYSLVRKAFTPSLNSGNLETKLIATSDFEIFKWLYPAAEGTATANYGTIVARTVPALGNIPEFRMQCILVHPLSWIHTVSHGRFIHKHWIHKLCNQQLYISKDSFDYTEVTPSNKGSVFFELHNARLVGVDIETSRDPCRITSVAYTALSRTEQGWTTKSYVIKHTPDNYPFCMHATRYLNATGAPKVMQNGMYDSLYFILFNAPLINWCYDTYHFMHCLYPELPKDLSYISAFVLSNFLYWKDDASVNLYRYNAKDTHNTVWTMLGLINYIEVIAPHKKEVDTRYAYTNFVEEFSTVWPCLYCDMEGVLIDEKERKIKRDVAEAHKQVALKSLEVMLGQPLNPSSPKQVKAVMGLFAIKVESTEESALLALGEKNPLAARLVEQILVYREHTKAISTYFDVSVKAGRLFYHLDPAGTDTGRLASKASALWCGTQIQNIPPYARSMVVFEEGWKGGAVDKAQSESYCTAYIAQEPKLKEIVNNSPDFHSANASMFFGIPFEQIYDALNHKKLRKDIRDLAKRVNHGANYNMGAYVLLRTMGTKNVLQAKRLLQLPQRWTLMQCCAHLLGLFDKVYPRIRGAWQQEIKSEVARTGKLTFPTGWVRRTFLNPMEKKLDLNSCVACKPQGTSAQLVNKAMREIFWTLQLNPKSPYYKQFRLKMQIHDELVFIAKPEIFEQAITDVMNYMIVPLKIHNDIMRIPSSRAEGQRWSQLKD